MKAATYQRHVDGVRLIDGRLTKKAFVSFGRVENSYKNPTGFEGVVLEQVTLDCPLNIPHNPIDANG